MQGFEIVIFDQTWTEGFDFVDNPSIEIVNNHEAFEIYEKPYLDFKAYGDLATEFELALLRNFCTVEPISIFQNGVVIWNGVVRISDVKSVYNSAEGSYKMIEVLDRNLNLYFKNRNDVVIELDSPWDLLCNRIFPPQRGTYTFFEPDTPTNTFTRQMYLFTDALTHVIELITEGNVILVSDFFTNTKASTWLFGTGDQLALELSGSYLPFVSWEDLTHFMGVTYRLVRYHYQVDGQQYVRIEPWDHFFDASGSINYDAVSDVKYGTKLERLYSTAKVGDPSEVNDDTITPSFVDFEFDDYDEQIVGVGGSCGSGTELDIGIREILVSTDKIEFCIEVGDTEFTYRKSLFVVESDGTNATPTYRGFGAFYNESFLNSRIIRRWFNGSSPISVYPENFTAFNYFKASSDADSVASLVVGGSPISVILGSLWFEGTQHELDPDGVLGSVSKFNQINASTVSTAPNASEFTCSKPGPYKIDVNWNVAVFGGVSSFDPPIEVYARVLHLTAGGSLIASYDSPVVVCSDGTTFSNNKLVWETPTITIGSGEKIQAYMKSRTITNVVAGVIAFGIAGGSYLSVVPCSQFSNDFEVGGKQFIFQTEFDGYPLSREDFERVRNNPGLEQRVKSYAKSLHTFKGFIESLKYDLITREARLLISGSDPTRQYGMTMTSSEQCWAIENGVWDDSCFWDDSQTWID